MLHEDDYYAFFFEGKTGTEGIPKGFPHGPARGSVIKPFNKTATNILNNDQKCFGNCYVLYFNSDYEFYNLDKEIFIAAHINSRSSVLGQNRTKYLADSNLNLTDLDGHNTKCKFCRII